MSGELTVSRSTEKNVDHLLDTIQRNMIGALVLGVLFIGIAAFVSAGIRRFTRRIESRLSDVTGLRFVSALAHVLSYLIAFILYAHLIPELRAFGTTFLAGVGVVSVVLGLAAQNTLGNLVAGLSLVLYRPIQIGDNIQLNTPRGLTTATVEAISLGYTVLRDTDKHEVIVPNSVMGSSVVIRIGSTNEADKSAGLPRHSVDAKDRAADAERYVSE